MLRGPVLGLYNNSIWKPYMRLVFALLVLFLLSLQINALRSSDIDPKDLITKREKIKY